VKRNRSAGRSRASACRNTDAREFARLLRQRYEALMRGKSWLSMLALVAFACGGESESGSSGGNAGTNSGGASGGAGNGGQGASSGSGGAGASSGGGSGGAGAGAAGGAGPAGAAGSSGAGGASGGSGTVDCNPSDVSCKKMQPTCPPGEVASVDVATACWGPCVPVLDCKTVPDCSECKSAFCAEYVGWTKEYRCVVPTVTCAALACSCLAQYFCVAPYSACVDGAVSGPAVSCECPAC
jgi:hypothetical protein